ncbi:MAG TPA: von Willebrand factor type A domain-containing protein [Acidobacteriota bacterium]|nr:von Willebrand factor type A domain-containing protein [Acidobacteriota bacterium]
MARGRVITLVALVTIAVLAAGDSQATVNGAISGSVLDARSGQPVVGASLELLGTGKHVVTDSLGGFAFEEVSPGVYSVEITYQDSRGRTCQSTVEVTVRAAVTATLAVPLAVTPDTDLSENHARPLDGAGKAAGESDQEGKSSDSHKKLQSDILDILTPEYAPGSGVQSFRGGRTGEVSGLDRMPPAKRYEEQEYEVDRFDEYPTDLPPFDMFFKNYGTNRFVETRRDRLSTFALDVDDASYNLARRYLQQGRVPPPEAIRVEEFINHFNYGYNPPRDSKFRIFSELLPSPFNRDVTVMKIGVKGREVAASARKPLNLTFVIDVSGSMGYDDRLEVVKQALEMLIAQLGRHDRVGMVAYGSQAFVVLEPVSADQRQHIVRAVRSLRPEGRTYAEAGLELGYRMAGRQYVNGHSNRVILISDGVANVGRTSADDIMRRIEHSAVKGITLSCFGVGMGNYNDVLLEQLARQGNGRYAYINSVSEARRQFVDGFVGNVEVLARDVKVQVNFNPDIVEAYRLLGYENRDIPDDRFRDRHQDGAEIGAGHEVTAVYELRLRKRAGSASLATVHVRWKNPDETEITEISREVASSGEVHRFERARPEPRLAFVAAQFAQLLKRNEYAQTDYDGLLSVAEPLVGQMPGPQVRELVDLIRQARDLSTYYTGRKPYRDDDDNYQADRR